MIAPPAISPVPINMATLEQLYMEYGRLMVDKEIIDNRINAVKQMLNTRLAERQEALVEVPLPQGERILVSAMAAF